MPVNGLPFAVEGALNNLLSTSYVTSWKIQGHGQTTTIVIKMFDEQGVMAENATVQYKKKPPSQVRRDRQRTEDFRHTHLQKEEKERKQEEMETEKREQEKKNTEEELNTIQETRRVKIDLEHRPTTSDKEEKQQSQPVSRLSTGNGKSTTEAVEATQQSHASAPCTPKVQENQHSEAAPKDNLPAVSKRLTTRRIPANLQEAALDLKEKNLDPEAISERVEICSKWMKRLSTKRETLISLSSKHLLTQMEKRR